MTESRPVIIGAGPAGVTCALALAARGMASLILDKSTFPRDKVCGDALSGKVLDILRRLDPTWEAELNVIPAAYAAHGIHFFAPGLNSVRIPFQSQTNTRQTPPGYVCRRIDFDSWLLSKAQVHPLIEVRTNVQVKQVITTREEARLFTTAGQEFTAPIVVGADGAHSVIRRAVFKNHPEGKHYCAAVRAYYQNVAGITDGYIELHFLKELLPGYIWIFPLPGGYANVGLGVRSDLVKRRRLNLRTLLEYIVTTHPTIGPRFQHAQITSPIQGFGLPLGSRQYPISDGRIILTGDAAALIDPFTGEGIGNAMLSGWIAAKHISESVDYSANRLKSYDVELYSKIGHELKLSATMQQLTRIPGLFDLVVRKAAHNEELRNTITGMFENIDLRSQFRNPLFYWRLLTS